MEEPQLADWVTVALDQVAYDVAQSRRLVHDAAGRLNVTFDSLCVHAELVEPLHAAVEALQFEDMVAQLLEGVTLKLEALRRLCEVAAADPCDPRLAELRTAADDLLMLRRVGNHEVAGSDVELF